MTTTIEVPVGTSVLNITQEDNRILLEFVPTFKNGDFLCSNILGQEDILIFKEIHDGRLYFHVCMNDIDDLDFYPKNYYINVEDFRLATEVEKKQLLSVMKESGKQWNAEKLRIEDIPQRKFKPGDKVKLKDGMLDKRWESPYFTEGMDVFIDKVLTVESYNFKGHIYLNEAEHWEFAEDWLEPYSDEPIVGELVIFWDNDKKHSLIRLYTQYTNKRHCDHTGTPWLKAIRFESKEQFEEHIKD